MEFTCDLSDSRLYQGWIGVLGTGSLQSLKPEWSRRMEAPKVCAGLGGNHSEVYSINVPPRHLPPVVPPNFNPGWIAICPFCYLWVEGLPVAAYFQKVSVPAGQKAVCSVRHHWSLRYSLDCSTNLNDIDAFVSTVWSAIYYSTLEPPKNPNNVHSYTCSDNGRWYTLNPAMDNWDICERCAYMVMWAFPVARQLIMPSPPLEEGFHRVCDLKCTNNRRFVPTMQELLRAQSLRSPAEFWNYVSRIAKIPVCQGPREAFQEATIYTSTTFPALDVCEDCYINYIENGDFGALFERAPSGKRPENSDIFTVCDYSAPLIKQKFAAVEADLEHDDKTSFEPFKQWLVDRRKNLQNLVAEWTAWNNKQKDYNAMRAQKYLNATRASASGLAVSSSVYTYGNGQYQNSSQWLGAKLLAEADAMTDNSAAMEAQEIEVEVQKLLK